MQYSDVWIWYEMIIVIKLINLYIISGGNLFIRGMDLLLASYKYTVSYY